MEREQGEAARQLEQDPQTGVVERVDRAKKAAQASETEDWREQK